MLINSMLLRLKKQRDEYISELQSIISYPTVKIKPFNGKFTRKKIRQLIKKSSTDVTRCYTRWTNKEEIALIREYQHTKNTLDLAIKHQRSEMAIRIRLHRLGLILKEDISRCKN